MVARLSTFSGSSGSTRRTCVGLVKVKRFRGSWMLRVGCALGWGLVGGERLYRSRSGQEREQGEEMDSC